MTKQILLGLILVTTTVFSLTFAFSQHVLIAAFAVAVGLFWLVQEGSQQQVAVTLFFLFFIGLAVVGSLNQLPALLMLFGLSTSLAAWDLSRFRERVSSAERQAIDPVLEARHLQGLFVPLGIGLLAALPPIFIRISIHSVVFFGLLLLVMLVLRASALNLRPKQKSGQQ